MRVKGQLQNTQWGSICLPTQVGLNSLLKQAKHFSPTKMMLVQRFIPFPAVCKSMQHYLRNVRHCGASLSECTCTCTSNCLQNMEQLHAHESDCRHSLIPRLSFSPGNEAKNVTEHSTINLRTQTITPKVLTLEL